MSRTTHVAVVPAAPGLLPRYAGLTDPFVELRAACVSAVRWLVAGRRDPVLALSAVTTVLDGGTGRPTRGALVAEHLLRAAGHLGEVEHVVLPRGQDTPDLRGRTVLVLADGSARRGGGAPGQLDERAFGFDAGIGTALVSGDVDALRRIDLGLGEELLAEGAPVLRALASAVEAVDSSEVTYADDPFGVQYWVACWSCRAVAGRAGVRRASSAR